MKESSFFSVPVISISLHLRSSSRFISSEIFVLTLHSCHAVSFPGTAMPFASLRGPVLSTITNSKLLGCVSSSYDQKALNCQRHAHNSLCKFQLHCRHTFYLLLFRLFKQLSLPFYLNKRAS